MQAGLIRPVISRLGERTTLIVGLLFGMAGFAIYGLATTSAGFWAGIPVMALWGLGGAASMGIMSRLVSGSEQGQLQGANSSLMALAGLFGPLLFSYVFAHSIASGRSLAAPRRTVPAGVGDAARGHCAGLVGTRPVSASPAT